MPRKSWPPKVYFPPPKLETWLPACFFSPSIRQCLLEVEDVNLNRAFELADILDGAQRQSLSIDKAPVSPSRDGCFTMIEDRTDGATGAGMK